MVPNFTFMKVKLSPFAILFLLLNSILIFCASKKIDEENKISSGLIHKNENTKLSAGYTFDSLQTTIGSKALKYRRIKNRNEP